MSQDRPLLGIALMLSFSALAPFADAIAKILGQTLPISLIVLIRFVAQMVILAPLVLSMQRVITPGRRVLWLAFLRTLLHILGIGLMVSALRVLPLADAIAIAFVLPFLMLLLGKFILKEEVGPRRLAACAVGFAGTLLIVQPSFQQVGWQALLPLAVAVNFAFFILITRSVSKDIDPMALQVVSGAMAVALLLPVLAVYYLWIGPGDDLAWPNLTEWVLLATMGLIGTLAHLLMTWSLRYAPSTTLAPIQYVELPITAFVGWLIFSDLPNGLAAIGITISVSAGIYIILRERATLVQPGPPIPPVATPTAAPSPAFADRRPTDAPGR
ncbi:DMT family transporter [Thalassovita sp.]|uniref:DMT family transporter n=1 Tax=Thalassovita sp. TaxID=1979401 RepID=UPI002B265D7D|nr:DMT family transporter [Thalassovita sp.]